MPAVSPRNDALYTLIEERFAASSTPIFPRTLKALPEVQQLLSHPSQINDVMKSLVRRNLIAPIGEPRRGHSVPYLATSVSTLSPEMVATPVGGLREALIAEIRRDPGVDSLTLRKRVIAKGHAANKISGEIYGITHAKRNVQAHVVERRVGSRILRCLYPGPAPAATPLPVVTQPAVGTAPAVAAAPPSRAELVGAKVGGMIIEFADRLAGYIVSEVTQQISSSISEQISAQVSAAVAEQLAAMQSALPETASMKKPAPRVRKKRVLIVGLKEDQVALIRSEYDKQLELDFLLTQDSPGRARDMMHHADAVIGMVGFVSHPHDGIIKRHARYFRISGGMTSLRERLVGLLHEGEGPDTRH